MRDREVPSDAVATWVPPGVDKLVIKPQHNPSVLARLDASLATVHGRPSTLA